MTRRRQARGGGWATAAVVAVVVGAGQCATYDRSVVPLDEGQMLAIADRLLHGEVLYRDIYTGIFPGVYYATAALLAVLGHDVVVTRWAQLGVNVATALCLLRIGVRVAGGYWAGLPPLLYLGLVAVSFPILTMLNYSSLSMLCALAALLFLLRYRDGARRADGIAVGVLLAACALVKQNFGGLAFVAILTGALWGRGVERRGRLAGLLPIAAGGAVPTLLAFGYLALAGAGPAFVDATITTVGDTQLVAYNDPLPPILGPHPTDDGRFIFMYTPPALFGYLERGETLLGRPISATMRSAVIRAAYGGTLALLVTVPPLLWLSRRRVDPGVRTASGIVVAFAALLFLGLFPSAIWSHLAFVLPPILLLAALMGDRVERALPRGAARVSWRGVAGAGVLAVLVVAITISGAIHRWHPEPMALERASVSVAPDIAASYRKAVAFLTACAPPETPVFVAPDLPLLYFLADRRNPTPFELTIPGNVDGPGIVARLEATRTRCVVLKPQMYAQFASFEELFPELLRYLDSAYERAETLRPGPAPWYGLIRREPRPS